MARESLSCRTTLPSRLIRNILIGVPVAKWVAQICAGAHHSVVRLESGQMRQTDQNASDGWVRWA